MRNKLMMALALLLCCTGCTVISYNRVFPKLGWYWSAEAKEQRREKAQEKAAHTKSLEKSPPPINSK